VRSCRIEDVIVRISMRRLAYSLTVIRSRVEQSLQISDFELILFRPRAMIVMIRISAAFSRMSTFHPLFSGAPIQLVLESSWLY
jgi:hypothetical protein